jgi:hypothetical protein
LRLADLSHAIVSILDRADKIAVHIEELSAKFVN